MFCSGAITAVWSAGIAWIKPSSVFEAIDAPSEGVIDVLLVPSWPTGRCRNGDSHVSPDVNATANSRLRLGFTLLLHVRSFEFTVQKEILADLAKGQRPYATILGCSDSRVPPELIFDAGFGELFIVRLAGNVISPEVMGTLQYAGVHLRTPLFVVLGHEGCGAVKAALAARHGAQEPARIALLLENILPGLRDLLRIWLRMWRCAWLWRPTCAGRCISSLKRRRRRPVWRRDDEAGGCCVRARKRPRAIPAVVLRVSPEQGRLVPARG